MSRRRGSSSAQMRTDGRIAFDRVAADYYRTLAVRDGTMHRLVGMLAAELAG